MSTRLACTWVREQMLSRAVHRHGVGPERAAKEEAVYAAAVAEVDEFLEPTPTEDLPDVWGDPEWVAAMGGEVAGVG